MEHIEYINQQLDGKYSFEKIQELRLRVQRQRDQNYAKLQKQVQKDMRIMDEKVVKQLEKKQNFDQIITAIQKNFQEVKSSKNKSLDQELDELLEKTHIAKKNVEATMVVVQDFVNLNEEIKQIQAQLQDAENGVDLPKIYVKINRMMFIKNQLQNQPDLSQEYRKKIMMQFQSIEETYNLFSKIIMQFIADIPLNLARSNPAMVVKILRILENEKDISHERGLSPFKIIQNQKPDTLRLKCVEHFNKSLIKKMKQSFIDLDRKDPKALYQSMEVTEELFKHLTHYVSKFVTPCFPPYYNIYENVKSIYLDYVFEHFTKYHIENLEEYMDVDKPEILIDLHIFIHAMTKDILDEPNNQQFQDMNILLTSFFPKFLDHSEDYFKQRFDGILDMQHQAELKLINLQKEKKKKKRTQDFSDAMDRANLNQQQFETQFDQDIFQFVDPQLEKIADCLNQEQLFKFIVRLLDSIILCTQNLSEREIVCETELEMVISSAVRINDLVNISEEYPDFKNDCTKSMLTLTNLQERAVYIFDDKFTQMLKQQQQISEEIAKVALSKIEMQNVLYLFSTREEKEEVNNNKDLGKIFDFINNFVLDLKKMLNASCQRNLEKIVENLYKMAIEQYLQRLCIIIISQEKFKPKQKDFVLDFENLPKVYKNHLLPKKDKDKILVRQMKIDSKAKFEILDKLLSTDIQQFIEFRDNNAKVGEMKEIIKNRSFQKYIQQIQTFQKAIMAKDLDDFNIIVENNVTPQEDFILRSLKQFDKNGKCQIMK